MAKSIASTFSRMADFLFVTYRSDKLFFRCKGGRQGKLVILIEATRMELQIQDGFGRPLYSE